MIFVQHDHLVWDPSRYRKPRKKWGRLIRSDKEKLDDMLSHHLDAVQDYLYEKKNEYEEQDEGLNNLLNHQQSGLRSPPLPSGTRSPRLPDSRQGSVPSAGNANMPPLGFFTVSNSPRMSSTNSPRSPRSPLRGEFRRI